MTPSSSSSRPVNDEHTTDASGPSKDVDDIDKLSLTSSEDDSLFSSNDQAYTHRLQRTGTASKSFTSTEETQLLRKLDRRLTLFLALLYLLSFLDRSNIGNARIAGLDRSLSLASGQYDWLLTSFYITYITFEWMILLYKLVPAHIYISLCVLSWGLVASLQSVVTNFPQLLILRSLLGVTEAAFGPGVPFYMTFFYKRHELAYRVGLQISAAPLASSFASSLAWLIVWITRKISVMESWRALFLVEGFPSILVAVWAWWWIPDSPGTARWLTPRERRVATLRMQEERDRITTTQEVTSINTTHTHSHWTHRLNISEIFTTLKTPQSYIPALMFFSVNVSFASLPVFLPTIIRSMSFSPLTSQILSAPPYLFAFAFVLLIGYRSDRTPNSRAYFIIAASLLSSTSYAVIALAGALESTIGSTLSITIRYIAVYGAAMGLFASVTLIITWTLNNQQSSTSKGAGMVLLNVVGQCGPLVGVHLFPKAQGPHYTAGMAVCAGFMAGVAGLAGGLRWWLRRENGRRREGKGVYEMVSPHGGEGGREVKDEQTTEAEAEESVAILTANPVDGRGTLKSEEGFRYML